MGSGGGGVAADPRPGGAAAAAAGKSNLNTFDQGVWAVKGGHMALVSGQVTGCTAGNALLVIPVPLIPVIRVVSTLCAVRHSVALAHRTE